MDAEAARVALMNTSREWALTTATGDLDRIVSYWADDAVVMPPGQPAVTGKAAIREFVRQTSALPGFSITWEPVEATISDDGALGYLVERNRVTLSDGETIREHLGKAVTVWRRDATGAWKCTIDIWNGNAP